MVSDLDKLIYLQEDRGYDNIDLLLYANITVSTEGLNGFSGGLSQDLVIYFNTNSTAKDKLFGKYLIPITEPSGTAVSLVTYDLINKLIYKENNEPFKPYSLLSNISKANLVYVPPKGWSNFKDTDNNYVDTVFIVDGMFDCIVMNYLGYPTFGLLGSDIPAKIIPIIQRFNRVIFVRDNDLAGMRLFKKIKEIHANVTLAVLPTEYKDVDEFYVQNKSLYIDKSMPKIFISK